MNLYLPFKLVVSKVTISKIDLFFMCIFQIGLNALMLLKTQVQMRNLNVR